MDESNEKSSTLFRKESLQRISSPDQLDEYLRVSGNGVWFLVIGILILLAGLFIWSIFGTLPSTVSMNGIVSDGVVTCYTDDASELEAGQTAKFTDGSTGTVLSVATTPISEAEAAEQYTDYDLYMLNLTQWNYEVTVSGEGLSDGYTNVKIVTGTTKPISFLTSGNS